VDVPDVQRRGGGGHEHAQLELTGELFAGELLRALAKAANAFEAEPAGRSLHAWVIGIPAQICSARLGALAAWRRAEADRHTATSLTRAASPHPARVWVTVRTGASPSDFSANLRAPILVADGRGHQVINEASDAPVRAPLFAGDVAEAAA